MAGGLHAHRPDPAPGGLLRAGRGGGPSVGAAAAGPGRIGPAGRLGRRGGGRRVLCGHAGPDGGRDDPGLFPAGRAAGGSGRGADGLSAVELLPRAAAARGGGLPVPGRGGGGHPPVHRPGGPGFAAGAALLGRGPGRPAAGHLAPRKGPPPVQGRQPGRLAAPEGRAGVGVLCFLRAGAGGRSGRPAHRAAVRPPHGAVEDARARRPGRKGRC